MLSITCFRWQNKLKYSSLHFLLLTLYKVSKGCHWISQYLYIIDIHHPIQYTHFKILIQAKIYLFISISEYNSLFCLIREVTLSNTSMHDTMISIYNTYLNVFHWIYCQSWYNCQYLSLDKSIQNFPSMTALKFITNQCLI
jgi:hypothetical protein